jgi:hypothetical protein
MAQDRSIIKCKVCAQLKVRILDRKVGKEKVWVSEDGKAWNGKTCSECHVEIVRLKLRDKRAKHE